MKYTKISSKIGSIVMEFIKVFILIALFLGPMVGLLYIDIVIEIPIISLLWFIVLPALVFGLNFNIAIFWGN